jgi:TPR repeat protein
MQTSSTGTAVPACHLWHHDAEFECRQGERAMSAPGKTTRAACCAGLLLILGACSTPRSSDDVDSGRFDMRLARMYMDGDGVKRDDAKAFYLVSNASTAGDIEAKDLLGHFYADGRIVTRDDELATNLYRIAVDGGNVMALNDLGQMIETGRGTKADPEQALDYYERGMDAGDENARQNYKRLKKLLDTPPPKPVPEKAAPQITAEPLPALQ